MKEYKYNIEIDEIDVNVPHGKILSQIHPGSTVLECGCATGYMTKFMREKLNCEVSIIEYDRNAFERARQYANDGICTDLMEDEWNSHFGTKKFDYVIFADVLEHLYDPLMVLKKACSFLKDDGYMMISIPNITHNDIIASMINNTWRYTKLGLLDDSHIHFWGENDLAPFFHEAGLSIVTLDYVIVPEGVTEQTYTAMNSKLQELLMQRSNGSVYQFVLSTMKTSFVQQNNIAIQVAKTPKENMVSNLYYSKTGDFNGCNAILGRYVAPFYSQRFHLYNKPTKFLRFDPIEQCACIVKDLKVINDVGTTLETIPVNGTRIGQYDLFITSDPQYRIINPENEYIHWLDIQAEITPVLDQSVISSLRLLVEKPDQLQELTVAMAQHQLLLQSKLMQADFQIKEYANTIARMKNSHSWKLTKPLRLIRQRFRNKK